MTARKSVIFDRVKNPSIFLSIAVATGVFGVYYWLAQSAALPGSEALRARWGTLTTRRGVSGNRMHRPRASGPIDLTLLGGISAFCLWKGVQARKRIQEAQP